MYFLKSLFALLGFFFISQASHSQSVLFVTNGNDSGAGSLRQAIQEASSWDTIRFSDDIDSVGLTSGELLIDKSLVIEGNPGRTCILRSDTTLHFRIFRVQSLDTLIVEFRSLLIIKGRADDGNSEEIHGQPGGGICIPDSIHEIVLKGCVLEGNMSGIGYRKYSVSKTGNGGNGGGIYSLSKLTLEDCILAQNICGPGADGWSGGDWSSQNAGNGGNGGGIFCLNDLELTGCTLTQNFSGNGGAASGGGYSGGGNGGSGGSAGAIYCMNSDVLIVNTLIENNNSGKGGNAYNYQTYCHAGNAGAGGAVALVNCSSNITTTVFTGNFTGRGGGGSGNPSGSSTSGGPGGALYMQGGQLTCNACSLSYNYTGTGSASGSQYELKGFSDSGHGAGMYIDTARFIIQNSSFTGNYTLKGGNVGYFLSGGSGGNGGGIYINRSADPCMISNCRFLENHTGDGITVGNEHEHGVFSGANGGHGGGIYTKKSTPVLMITGCIFKSNYCGNSVIPSDMASQQYFYGFPHGGSGGAVCNAGSNVQIINSTIAGNYCGTATIYTGDSLNLVPADSVRGKGGGLYRINEVINSIIAENSIGNEFPNEFEGTGSVNYSLIKNDTLAEFSGTGNLINAVPGFLNFPEDLSLAQNSLAINHGSRDTTGLFLPESDMDGNPRIYGDRIDMGAYEYQGEPSEQYSVSTDLIMMDSIVIGSYSVDSLTIFNYGSQPLIIFAETASPFSLSLDKTGWNNSLAGITIPEGLPVSPLVLYVKFESLSAGDYQEYITITTKNSSSIVTVKGYCKSTEGIIEENDELNVSVFPNPSRNETRISYFIEQQGDVRIILFNSSGIKLSEIMLPDRQKGINSYNYKNQDLKPGLYFLQLISGNQAMTRKLIIISK